MQQQQTAFENIVETEEIARNAISSFPTVFSTLSENSIPFVNIYDIILAAELEEPKNVMGGKGLRFWKRFSKFSCDYDLWPMWWKINRAPPWAKVNT